MSRTIRRLSGVTYWVLRDPVEIWSYINSNVTKEWEEDDRDDGVDPEADGWLLSLPRRGWSLRALEVGAIRLDPETMSRDGFVARLEERSDELLRCVTLYGAVIWPLVVRGEDTMLMDGYCRFSTLEKMGTRRALAYVGTSRMPAKALRRHNVM